MACDEECQQARVARKAELLRQQTRTQKADVKVLFGADFQAGRRGETQPPPGGKVPVLGEFLLPNDVGGINLQSGPAPAAPSQ